MTTHTPISHSAPRPRAWFGPVLIIAGIYNIIWGAMVVLYPTFFFERLGLETPRYTAIWQCVGMIVGVYGVGYLIASKDPFRHWPIVLVGLLGKVFGPIGFVYAALITNELPTSFGWVLIPNDLIWWVPFAMILYGAARHNQLPKEASFEPLLTVHGAIERADDQYGISVLHRSVQHPVMLVFLRHMGCTFCLQTLQDLQKNLPGIREQGVEPVIVHMSDDEQARLVMLKYGMETLPRVSDPTQSLYKAFELSRGTIFQLFGPRVWIGGLMATLRGNIVSGLKGDGFQMPGVFIIQNGKIVHGHRHRTAAERPDYSTMACGLASMPRSEVLSNDPGR
ncbi:MAG: SelL-related redox protein [Phycisphaerales bacterium]